MKCPYCEYEDTRVVDSRPTEDGAVIRRKRECRSEEHTSELQSQ